MVLATRASQVLKDNLLEQELAIALERVVVDAATRKFNHPPPFVEGLPNLFSVCLSFCPAFFA